MGSYTAGNLTTLSSGEIPPETYRDLEFHLVKINDDGDVTLKLTIPYSESLVVFFYNTRVRSTVGNLGGSYIDSKSAYLLYETNRQAPATGLITTANGTAIQVSWDASQVRTQYLVSISNVTETPVVVSSPHYTYFPESQDCQWYEFMVTAHQCSNTTDQDTRQITATSVRVAYPNISPVSLQYSGEEVLVDWLSGDNSTLAVIASLRNGSKLLMTHTDTSPFSYKPKTCGQYNINVAVSPVQCADEPDFTHSDSISFTIPCPTTATDATETEIPDQPSGTQAISPSLLAVAAIIPLLKITRQAF